MPELDRTYRLDDRFDLSLGRAYMTGTQALVRLLLAQAAIDRRDGLNTAGLVSGYRGSPLGAVDQELWRAKDRLAGAGIRFQPGINEDLAAAALLGSQRVALDPAATVEGVFGLWYGKGPGVDRSGDALKHGNAYGSSPKGGVLVVAGDDHGCVSSSMSHQSDLALAAWHMPVIHPGSLAEYEAFGLWGFAASRFSGAWVGFKAISEVVEGAASVALAPLPHFATPDFAPPPGGLHIRWPDLPSLAIEARALQKLEAIRAFARANPLDRLAVAPERPRLLVVTVGKAHGDAMEAFRLLGLTPDALAAAGIAVLKVGLVHPLDSAGIAGLAAGVETVLVIEEKAPLVERQLRDGLYDLPTERRPRILGKRDAAGAPLVPEVEELRPSRLTGILTEALRPLGLAVRMPDAPSPPPAAGPLPVRTPYFCSGCPHNTSTRVPDGSQARAGIGCHFMANWMERDTTGIVPMGAEGVDWTGQAPFTRQTHVFQNLGDGTYFHSGHAAIRQAVASGANITYKILYNDAVAMTGGQPVDGVLTVPQITRLMAAEGARKVVVVSDDPARVARNAARDPLGLGVTVHHRDDLDAVQRALRETPGVTVLVYDQTCATEARRRRKRGLSPQPARRAVINPLVCEGCGDCQAKSNCLSVVPVETEFGRKRAIDQTGCNSDLSCLKGFCPSFVTLEGATPRRRPGVAIDPGAVAARAAALPEPDTALGDAPYEILVAGVGGTGVVTVGALITMAAHLEGHGASVLDFMGFAQKGGQVLSFVRLAADPALLHQVRIDRGRADAVLACDLVVAASADAAAVIDPARTRIVANTHEIPTGTTLRDPNARIDTRMLEALLARRVGAGALRSLDAQAMAARLIGDAQAANVLLLGFAWQCGLVPVSRDALDQAVTLNGVAVAGNRLALAWGRLLAAEPEFVAGRLAPEQDPAAQDLDTLVARRAAFLAAYQDAAYAARYRTRVATVRERGGDALAEAVARSLFKLMAVKDEYEVARLQSDPAFHARLADEFEASDPGGRVRPTFHLAPPFLARARPGEAEPRKIAFGPWLLPVLRGLARLKGLRGRRLDPLWLIAERREERAVLAEYEAQVDAALALLGRADPATLRDLLAAPEAIRGFGPVKARAISAWRARSDALLAAARTGNDAGAPLSRAG
ncbi:indolepyruvate ferredoxin oxidoreductase family protein [Methylobacterium platani]|uniref:Pyruvate ferredoxin oxidoreductase n=2 Tax=Methylobacterium platani TaxID=427683 RepID=A0A179S9Q7_9HYPH|nr:indolepyruvate ferredoxin oxidoreductase family protein [Methylobacterium platani]KMO13498.1 pyruvate ferredoxin oxidoreductase [Methylobacterium platani JCM 14648]OAS24480.1 pyruvate ferredoxin oxidoreductase [Methylobacterium platani]